MSRHLAFVLFAIAGALLLAASPTSAQPLACTGGSAGIYSCDSVDLESVVSLDDLRTGATNDVWGWTDPSNGREYAHAGTRSGTGMVDVTDPAAPILLGKLLTASGNSTWRDIKVYNNHVFVVSESSGHGMQVFDLTQLRGLSEDGDRDFTEDVLYTGSGGNSVGSAHDIVINEDSGFAYIVGSSSCGGGLHMVNIQNPTSPVFAGCYSGSGYVHDAQCVIYSGPDSDYTGNEICVTSNGGTTVIVDVTDKSNPSFIANVNYPNTGYAHQGWFTEDQRFFIADDEADEFSNSFPGTRTIIFDFEDLDNPEIAFEHFGTVFTSDHNQYVRGHYVFQSNYNSGLRILDLTNIESGILTEAGFFDTYPGGNSPSYNGQWSNYPFFPSGTIIATDQNNGLFILKTTFPITTDATAPVEAPGEYGYALSSAYPNPFGDDTRLTLSVARAQHVSAEVLDITGRRVAMVYDGTVSPDAPTALEVEGTDLAAGLYLIRVTGEDFTATQRISVVH